MLVVEPERAAAMADERGRRERGVKGRLIAVVLTALLPAVAMLGYNEFLSRQQRRLEIHRVAAQTTRQTASEVEHILDGTRNLLAAVSAIPAVVDEGGQPCIDGLKRIIDRMASINSVIVLDTDGKLVCDSNGREKGTDFSDRPYFAAARAGGAFAVGGYTISRPSGLKVLPVAIAMEKDGVLRGFIVAGIRLDWLQGRIEERGLLPGGTVTIADRDGIILVRNPHPEAFVGTRLIDDSMPLVRKRSAGTREMTGRDGVARIIGYEPVLSEAMPLFVAAGIAKEEGFASIDQASIAGVAIIAVGALLAIAAALLVGNRFLIRPIAQIVDTLERWRAGDETARTRLRGRHGEIGLVGATIDSMLEELDERRRVAEAAGTARNLLVRELSHRVKNTFSVVQAIARQTFGRRDAAEYESFSQRLGALAGAYDILVSGQWQSGDIREVVVRALRPHRNDNDDHIALHGDPCRLPAQAVLSLSLVVHELATNAPKYGALSHPDGRIDVTWRHDGAGVAFSWIEHCGKPLTSPARQGFGSRLIRSAFPGEYAPEAKSVFEPTGLVFTLHFRLDVAE